VVHPLADIQSALGSRYTVQRELGRGGMAIVYLATDLKHERLVAIKVLHPELAAALGPERFLREIKLTAGLNHPHILPLLDSGDAGGFLYYVMPYVEGESLRDRLERERQLPVDDALHIAREVADALGHAHSRGIVHRDIKPENILLARDPARDRSGTDEWHALVADFGIARAISAAGGEQLTGTGLAIGTPTYMSPEQASGERELDGRADIYALGCVLYEMLAGQPPFSGSTAQSIMARHAIDAVPPLHTVRPVSPAVEAAVLKALAKVPADRFATATQFRQALSVGSTVATLASPSWMLRGRGKHGLWVAAALVLIAAIVTGGYLLRSRGGVDPAASMIAVMPLRPSGADTGLVRLGRDLVVTLSANLDGVGDIRSVDANTILVRASDGPASLPLADAAALARRLGAGRVIHGSLLRMGTNVRVELGLFDSRDLSSLARSTVTASPDELAAITDSLTSAVLAQVWQEGTPPSPSLAAVTTHSMPALRAFLDGERLLVEGNMDSAASAYRRAFTADTTFWLAYFRYAYVFNWTKRDGADSLADIAWQHRSALPERERILLEIPREDSLSVRLRRSQEFVDRYPDYWPGWFQYADYLVHSDGTGYTFEDASDALERTVELNPDVAWAWEHLFNLTLTNDTPKAARALAEMERLGSGANPRSRPFYLPAYRLLLRTAVRSVPDTALMDSVIPTFATQGSLGGLDFTLVFVGYGRANAQIVFNRRALQYRVERDLAVNLHLGIATAWASRGAWDSMQGALDEIIALAPKEWGADPEWQAYRYNVFGAWLGALDPSAAVTRRSAMSHAASRPPGLSPYYELAFLPWLDGVQADAVRDVVALRLAREVLRADTLPSAPPLGRSLAAFEMGLAGKYRLAADSMVALVRAVTEGSCCKGTVDDVNRLAASRWLLAVGDTVAAGEILGHLEVDQWHLVFSAPLYLARARIDEALGRKEEARRDYAEFLRRYDMPVASQRHLVGEAKAALQRLSGQQDPPAQR
jgi:tRNA A-37 threonylcarbamoyl transferase component Bud32/tetratricopeptide (TPR) repeat protein/TolB-like protein